MQLLNCSLHYLHKDILHPPPSTHLPHLPQPPLTPTNCASTIPT
jgi:hypothetical protein